MRPGDSLFDTNALITWMNDEPELNRRFRGRDVFASAVSVGELWFGAGKSRRRAENEQRVARLLLYAEVIPIDASVARRYGALKVALRAAGKPIPDNDLWIAATALEHGLRLVTRDKHFEHVPELQWESW